MFKTANLAHHSRLSLFCHLCLLFLKQIFSLRTKKSTMMSTMENFATIILLFSSLLPCIQSFGFPSPHESSVDFQNTRRSFITSSAAAAATLAVTKPAVASTSDAKVTDTFNLEFQGLNTGSDSSSTISSLKIGLFGEDAPKSVAILKQLLSKDGLSTPCKPKAERTLQREQLEANKVYNACIENEQKGLGVTLLYSTVWRVIENDRIDVGAVTGKFVARESPDFQDVNSLRNDSVGVVSVRKGNDGGFGFTINMSPSKNDFLDEDNIVIGRVLMDSDSETKETLMALSQIPVVKSSSVNYMGLTGGTFNKSAPSRACRYGGPMYCNENKPLQKITLVRSNFL